VHAPGLWGRLHIALLMCTFFHPIASTDDLIAHALRALRECLPTETKLNSLNCTIAIVGEGTAFTELDEDKVCETVQMVLFPAPLFVVLTRLLFFFLPRLVLRWRRLTQALRLER
jgi:hypothetical protein